MILLNALAFALAGFAWSYKITQPGEIGAFWPELWFGESVRLQTAPAWKVWIASPLWYCNACVAGQMAFWCTFVPAWDWYGAGLTALVAVGWSLFLSRIYERLDR
jgi:hypothetical protein